MQNQMDLPARRQFCGLMRQFAIGRITNDEFDEAFDGIETNDQDLWRIGASTFAYYNEYVTVRLTGKYRLSREWRQAVARWILFLHSGQEYKDVKLSWSARLRWVAHGLTGGMVSKGSEITHYEEHERLVWPFATQADFDEARRHPKLLCGAHQ